jgi:hypothetical protein
MTNEWLRGTVLERGLTPMALGEQLLVNAHGHGVTAAGAPVWHLRKIAGGELAALCLDCFEVVWDQAAPLQGPEACPAGSITGLLDVVPAD